MTSTREDVVREALSWVGTPFHHHAGVKGAGCDCAHLLWRVAQATGFLPPDAEIPKYKPQWFAHRDEPLFLMELEKRGAKRIEPAEALAGDILMYDFGRHAAHGSIVIDANSMVHAYLTVGRVTRGDRRELEHRLDSAWTMFA